MEIISLSPTVLNRRMMGVRMNMRVCFETRMAVLLVGQSGIKMAVSYSIGFFERIVTLPSLLLNSSPNTNANLSKPFCFQNFPLKISHPPGNALETLINRNF